MPKRKKVDDEACKLSGSRRSRRNVVISKADRAVHNFDLRGHAKTPDALKCYLRDHRAPTTFWAIKTDNFPRGCMQVLLDHASDQEACIQRFVNEYGKVYKYHLQNPELKALVKGHGKWLTHLQMTPMTEAPSPKLQGCGYRWTAQHTKILQVLEMSLRHDVKRQLLDLTRRNPLRLECLQEIILWDVGSNTTIQQLVALVTRAKKLRRLVLYDAELGEKGDNNSEDGSSLARILECKAKEAGNEIFRVEILERKD